MLTLSDGLKLYYAIMIMNLLEKISLDIIETIRKNNDLNWFKSFQKGFYARILLKVASKFEGQ